MLSAFQPPASESDARSAAGRAPLRGRSIMTDTTQTSAAKAKPAKPATPPQPAFTPQLAGLENVIEDARRSALDSDPGPDEPSDYAALLESIQTARAAFPPLYEQEFVDPFEAALQQLGRAR